MKVESSGTSEYIFISLYIPVFIHMNAQKAVVQAKTAIKLHKIWLSWQSKQSIVGAIYCWMCSVFSCQIMELKPCIIVIIQLFKVAVRKPQSSNYLLLYQTQPHNSTPEKTRILQPLLSIRLLMYFQRNHSLLLFSFCKGSYDCK